MVLVKIFKSIFENEIQDYLFEITPKVSVGRELIRRL